MTLLDRSDKGVLGVVCACPEPRMHRPHTDVERAFDLQGIPNPGDIL